MLIDTLYPLLISALQLAARGAGSYTAEVTLPVCITGSMDWQATVLIETGGERVAIPYRFSTGESH